MYDQPAIGKQQKGKGYPTKRKRRIDKIQKGLIKPQKTFKLKNVVPEEII